MNAKAYYSYEKMSDGKVCLISNGSGKSIETGLAQDRLTAALFRLARTVAHAHAPGSPIRDRLVADALFSTVGNTGPDPAALAALERRVNTETARAAVAAFDGTFDMSRIWQAPEAVRFAKAMILFGLRGLAGYAARAATLGHINTRADRFCCSALAAVADGTSLDVLEPIVRELGETTWQCLEVLDRLNVETYGTPSPVTVSLSIEPGPFIVATGPDLRDLHDLLEHTKNTGIAVYTHDELFFAHAYPELRKYPHLKGHFGVPCHSSEKDFDGIPAPVLWTTHCPLVPRPGTTDLVYTLSPVSFPGVHDIGSNRNFAPLIRRARDLGGFPQRREFKTARGNTATASGFGHGAVLPDASRIAAAIMRGDYRRIFIIGGGEGPDTSLRARYYNTFIQSAPQDTLILTLGGPSGTAIQNAAPGPDGLPRVINMGLCNDASGALRTIVTLADACHCVIGELPFSVILSRYSQKSICLLLTLLAVGAENILLGPIFPSFVPPKVLALLARNYRIAPVTDPEHDLAMLLGNE